MGIATWARSTEAVARSDDVEMCSVPWRVGWQQYSIKTASIAVIPCLIAQQVVSEHDANAHSINLRGNPQIDFRTMDSLLDPGIRRTRRRSFFGEKDEKVFLIEVI